MKSDPGVIEHLNKILKNELTAINQYFLHARMLKDWGFYKLADKVYQESIGEMKHADMIINRLLDLDGHPNLQDLGRLKIGENVPEMFECDMGVETFNQQCLKEAIAHCEEVRDFVTRDEVFQIIINETEEHIVWLETQMGLVKDVGVQNYLQEHMYGSAEEG